ncbi:hypothetical protein [Streptomyces sp. NPDC045251]|uniref:hypothetical protein n=1 Tax=unclassified Streptomyces TaxID=2593676 RepID=UPI0033C4C586
MNDGHDYWTVRDTARYLIGCHQSWLRADLGANKAFWRPLLVTGPQGGCLIDVTALADIMARDPERMSWPKTVAPWATRSAKRRRKRKREAGQ